jgi:hypothetical protein
MNAFLRIAICFLACTIGYLSCPLPSLLQTVPAEAGSPQGNRERDGEPDFDFNLGTWKTRLSRRLHPLTGSTTWVEYEGTSVVRKVWNGRANLLELEVDGPSGHIEGLSLRLYNPQSHQWSLTFANSNDGTLSQPTIGEFKNGRGEFFDQETLNGQTIFVRFVISDITPNSCRFEQAFSDDGGKTWEGNWIATDTRVKDQSDKTAGLVSFQEASPPSGVVRQRLADAWWTGPILAPSAATLPRGHFLIEPYLYDVTVHGRYDRDGVRKSAAHSNGFGSLTYVLYGLTDRVTVGMVPTAGFNRVSDGPSSSGVGLGDVSLQAQYRLTQFHARSWIPTTSVVVQETFPTGKYDRLGDRMSDGLGSGAYTTTLALYSQTYFWLPSGRILRMRFDLSQAFSKSLNVEDVSVYGTGAGFRGHAKPGSSIFVDASWEYSLTRSWVLALDATYRHDGNTRVTGFNIRDPNSVQNPPSIRLDSGSREAFGLVPAIEYSWKRNLGVILGTRVIAAGRNTPATITPAMAINFVH